MTRACHLEVACEGAGGALLPQTWPLASARGEDSRPLGGRESPWLSLKHKTRVVLFGGQGWLCLRFEQSSRGWLWGGRVSFDADGGYGAR